MPLAKLQSMKGFQPIVCLTAYDYNIAKLLEEEQVDIILVGDSLGMVVLGYGSTKEVTMEDMLRHTGAVRRGALTSFIVADMPFGSDETPEKALENAGKLIDGGADAVKLEGKPGIAEHLARHGMQVMGHTGLLPQTAPEFRVQGKDKAGADLILKEAKDLEKAGCFAVVLESIPAELGRKITEAAKVPTIGIGAGPFCDGQVLVVNDLLGMFEGFKPKFAKRYADINGLIKKAVFQFKKEVKQKKFPGEENSY